MDITCHSFDGKLGMIYTTINGIAFPSDDWDDFCMEIISDWICEINACSTDATFTLYFMDGPYYLRCRREDDALMAEGIDGHDDSVACRETTSFAAFRQHLIEIANELHDQ